MTDMLRIRMWAMGLAMEHTPEDADREATEIVAQWLVDWATAQTQSRFILPAVCTCPICRPVADAP